MADVYRGPSFLKKIMELPMRGLTLPLLFLKTHGKSLRSDVILEGPSRKTWKVVVNGTFPSSNVTFGHGWEEFVTAHVLQLGDQLCFTLTANSHFQVEVYDESGCQKTSAIDATAFTASAFSFSRRPSALQIPPVAIQNLGDPATKIENPAVYTKAAGEEDLSLGSVTDTPLLLRRESAMESIWRDSARRSSAVRDPYVLPSKDGESAILQSSNNQRGLVPDYLLEFADCFFDIEKILSEPPDLTDTEPLVIEDIPPCWELNGHHTPAVSLSSLENTKRVSSLENIKRVSSLENIKRVSTLFSSHPPDSGLPLVSPLETAAMQSGSLINQETATERESLRQTANETDSTRQAATERDSMRQTATKRDSTRLSSLEIPLVSQSVLQIPTSTTRPAMSLSQIQNIDDLTLKAENLAHYTKAAAEKAISDIQLESTTSSPLAGSPLSRRESSIFKAESIGVQTEGVD